MLLQLKSMKLMKESTEKASYKNLWSAGQSVEMIEDIKTIEDIVNTLMVEMEEAYKNLKESCI